MRPLFLRPGIKGLTLFILRALNFILPVVRQRVLQAALREANRQPHAMLHNFIKIARFIQRRQHNRTRVFIRRHLFALSDFVLLKFRANLSTNLVNVGHVLAVQVRIQGNEGRLLHRIFLSGF